MRIEKINENQIRCYLTRSDMESRQLHLKELAYGTEKARLLFRELMQKAYRQYGFSAENMPVMIEAIPMFDESIVLNITRVENPEELDTRFSSFAPSVRSGGTDSKDSEPSALGQLLESIRQNLSEEGGDEIEKKDSSRNSISGRSPDHNSGNTQKGVKNASSGRTGGATNPKAPVPGPQLFTFRSLLDASTAAAAALDFSGTSSLYRDPAEAKYYLFLNPDPAGNKKAFGRWLSAFSEFGTSEYMTPAREQHLREHCEVICPREAVQRLAALGQN